MKRLIIVVEGDTEKEFVEKTLRPYFATKDVFNISCYKIKKTNGGLTNYDNLKTDLLSAIHEENVIVTTLIDFYALPKNFPQYDEAKLIGDKEQRLSFLEESIINDLAKDGYLPKLHPYIQLHEFEALLFTNIEGFELNFSGEEADLNEIKEIIESHPNPETINDGLETAPSKRLKNLIPAYKKIVYGNIIIETNGIGEILNRCPRFRLWTEQIINKVLN